MKATIDIPEELHRRVKARAALEGRSIRDVAIELLDGWVSESVGRSVAGPPAAPGAASANWLRRWEALNAKVVAGRASTTSTREILTSDRR